MLCNRNYMSNVSKANRLRKEIRFADTRCKGWGKRELDEFSQKVQSSSYKINRYEGCKVEHDKYN